jgi:hypothetical protein
MAFLFPERTEGLRRTEAGKELPFPNFLGVTMPSFAAFAILIFTPV